MVLIEPPLILPLGTRQPRPTGENLEQKYLGSLAFSQTMWTHANGVFLTYSTSVGSVKMPFLINFTHEPGR